MTSVGHLHERVRGALTQGEAQDESLSTEVGL
jgi:hypothetical protein